MKLLLLVQALSILLADSAWADDPLSYFSVPTKNCVTFYDDDEREYLRICGHHPPTIWLRPDVGPADMAAKFLAGLGSLGFKVEKMP